MTNILSKLLLSNILYIPVIYVALRKISSYSYLMCEQHGKLKMFFHARNYALNIPPPNVAFKKVMSSSCYLSFIICLAIMFVCRIGIQYLWYGIGYDNQ